MSDTAGLRPAMLNPCYWPEVRRGSERVIHDLGAALAARGHQPTLITSHRGPPATAVEDGLRVIRLPRPPGGGRLRRRGFEDHLSHVPVSYAALRSGHYDLAHAWYPTDALAAGRWGRLTGKPSLLSYMGIPDHLGLMLKRRRLEITLRAIDAVDAVVTLSHHAARAFDRWLGHPARVIHPPVDLRDFSPGPGRSDVPTILCSAVADDPGKRVALLVAALERVRRERPEVRLVLLRPRDPALEASLERPGLEFVEAVDDAAALAARYREAWVTALPSLYDSFGIVLIESMACGTPVVGTKAGAIPEVVDRPEVGRLFEGDEKELARALLEGLELAQDPASAAACRRRAEDFSVERCAEAYVSLYSELLG